MELILFDILLDASTLIGINVWLWLVSLPLGKTWPVDFIWSTWPAVQCVLILLRSAGLAGNCNRQVLVCVLVAVWGYRLTHNFVSRGGIGHEDWRYSDMRVQFGKHFWWISLFSVFLGQTIFMFAACLSLYAALGSELKLGWTDAAAVVICMFAILLEATADMQMDFFQAAKREKRTDMQVLDTGLWGWSRHPNYLGEILWWWGLWLFSMRASPPWVIVGPLLITLLFTCVSIKLMEDRQLKSKPEEYSEYKSRVGSPLLLFPPVVNRWLGKKLHPVQQVSTTNAGGS